MARVSGRRHPGHVSRFIRQHWRAVTFGSWVRFSRPIRQLWEPLHSAALGSRSFGSYIYLWKGTAAGLHCDSSPLLVYGGTGHICAGLWEQPSWGQKDAASLDYPPSGTRVGEKGYLRRSGIRAWARNG